MDVTMESACEFFELVMIIFGHGALVACCCAFVTITAWLSATDVN